MIVSQSKLLNKVEKKVDLSALIIFEGQNNLTPRETELLHSDNIDLSGHLSCSATEHSRQLCFAPGV